MVQIFLKWGCIGEHIHSQRIAYSGCRSVYPQFGEAEGSAGTGAGQCTAVDGGSGRMYFSHLKSPSSKGQFVFQVESLADIKLKQ